MRSTSVNTSKINSFVTAASKTFLEAPCLVLERSFLTYFPQAHHRMDQEVTPGEATRGMGGAHRGGGWGLELRGRWEVEGLKGNEM